MNFNIRRRLMAGFFTVVLLVAETYPLFMGALQRDARSLDRKRPTSRRTIQETSMYRHSNLARLALAAVLFLGSAGTASAAPLPAGHWRGEVNQSAASLRAGNYATALKAADHVLSDMV